jgi:ribonucleoside-diphosphate reductase beta chain
MDSLQRLQCVDSRAERQQFLLNLICFAACVEGLFFFGHMAFAFDVVNTIRREEPDLFDADLTRAVCRMIDEAVVCETQFADDLLGGGVAGLSVGEVRRYLEYCADRRLVTLGLPKLYGTRNPLAFMDLQDVLEVANFFERRVSAYQVGVTGEVVLDGAF